MPISHTDYERPAETTSDASGTAAAIAKFVKQTKRVRQWMAGQISVSRETSGSPTPQYVRPKRHTAWNHRREMESPVPQDRAFNVEKAATKARGEPDNPPTKGSMTEPSPEGPKQVIPLGHIPPEERGENAVFPEAPGTGQDFKNRFDAAQGLIRSQIQNGEELQALLDQAITLLESVSQHPAIRDYNANKLKLDEIEQRLGYGAYPQ